MKIFFKKTLQAINNTLFFKKTIESLDCLNMPKNIKSNTVFIFTITFNNEKLLEYQIKLLNKYIKDDFVFIVADNSSSIEKRKLIRDICIKNKNPYIGLPKNPFNISSNSHAAGLNWLYKNYITLIKPKKFGFIDHDLFPINYISIKKYLETQPFYGPWQGKKEHWYLWAGMCFFDFDFLKNKNIDFSPCIVNGYNLDTGGANWFSLYNEINQDGIIFPNQEYIHVRDNGDSIQSNKMEIIGDWLHSFNGSYWMNMKPKEDLLIDYLKKYL